MYKVQLSLTPQEATILGSQANRIGYNVTKFIKLLIGKQVLSLVDSYPTVALSQKAIQTVEKAHEEHKAGKDVLSKTR